MSCVCLRKLGVLGVYPNPCIDSIIKDQSPKASLSNTTTVYLCGPLPWLNVLLPIHVFDHIPFSKSRNTKMKGLYGTGSTTVRVHKSHRILCVGGRLQQSLSLSTGSKHSCGLRPRHFSVFQASKNYPLFLNPSLNQPWLPEGAVYSVRL